MDLNFCIVEPSFRQNHVEKSVFYRRKCFLEAEFLIKEFSESRTKRNIQV